jgi:Na+/melibiose symporter-like transporter
MSSQRILRAVPGVVAVFLVGLLLGAWIGTDGPIGYIIGICALVMIAAAARLHVVQQQKKERVAPSVRL